MVESYSDQPLPGPEAEQTALEDHIALIYEAAEERLSAITPLIKVGLEKGELCLYISNEENDQDIVEALKAEHIDVEKAVGTGGLILTSKKEMYFKLGRFDPDWTLRVLKNIADLARSYGFTAMRIMSEMTWTQENVPGVERWPEYEAKLNSLNPGISLRIICQYDRRAFQPEALMAAIKTHPKVVSQGAVSKNRFYIPADRLLAGDYASMELERMLETISVSTHSEAELQNKDQLIARLMEAAESNAAARQGLEAALEEARRRFNEFAERSSDWAWELDESGRYTYTSPRVRDILGLQPDEVLGLGPLDLVSQEEADRVSSILTKAIASRVPITALEKEARHKDGHLVFLEMNGTPVFDRNGQFCGYRGIDRDITGRKSAKHAIEESRRRAEEAATEIQGRDQRIQALEEAIAQLRQQLVELEAHKASLALAQQNLMDKEVEISRLTAELEQARGQYTEKELALGELTATYKQQALELSSSRGTMAGMEESLTRKEEELVTLRQQMDRMESELRESRQAVQAMTAERAAQGVALAESIALSEGIKADLALQLEEVQQAKEALKALESERERIKKEAEQARLDLLVQEAVVLGVKDARRFEEAELQRAIKEAEQARLVVAAKEMERQAAQSDRDIVAGELCASRSLLTQKDSELATKKEALSESDDRYRAIFEQAGSGIARIDLEGRILEANDKFYSMLGYGAEDLVGRSYRDITHRDDLVETASIYERLAAGEFGSLSMMKRYVRKLGSTIWANVTMSAVKDESGSPRYIMAIVDDRTDQMLAELALKEKEEREGEERYKNVIENVPEGVWVLDTEGNTTFVNQRMADLIGYPAEEMVGKPASEFMDPAWRRQQEDDPEGIGNEIRFRRKDGTDLWVMLSSMPILDQTGQSKGAIGLVNDITSLKSKEVLADSSRTAAVREAAVLRAAFDALPVPFMVVAEDGQVTKASSALEQILGAGALEGRPVSEIMPSLDLAAPGAVTIHNNGRPAELRAVATPLPAGEGTIVTFFEIALPAAPAPGPAEGSENLAHDLNDSLTVIMGSVSLAKEYVIPEGRMYSKLKQIESASVTARDLAGRLMASAKAAGAEEERPSALVKGKGRVLLMDDEESVLEATGDLLRYLGYTVEVARDGDEALTMCREARESKQPFDLAILDLGIAHGMGGREASQKLSSENPGLKLIVSSGYVTDPVMKDPASLGFVAAIPKPYSADVLSKVVARVLVPGR